jgi:S-adenosylmethionine:tRNA ribosyltransferase-isomerase
MRVEQFDYELPPDRIAQFPPRERGSSRLMVVDRARGAWTHSEFRMLPRWLSTGDLLVRNDTRVMRARLRGERDGGGDVELLLLRLEGQTDGGEVWCCLARPGRRLRRGRSAKLRGGIVATWLDDGDEEGLRRVRLEGPRPIATLLEEVGEVPLPPYIRRAPCEEDVIAYQTVYASELGAVAAPAAGLHFTKAMLGGLRLEGIEIVSLTLHVGPGTFVPMRGERIDEQRMAAERVEISARTADRVVAAKREGRRVVAIGTTTVRALEGALGDLDPRARSTEVDLFIVPGFRFRVVDALITNFHLPRSTLLILVAAFAGRELLLAAYRAAIAECYRFYSYGDAMLIV